MATVTISAAPVTNSASLDAAALAGALRLLRGARDRRTTLPALGCVRATTTAAGVQLAASNAATWMRVTIPAAMEGALDALVPWEMLDTLQDATGPVTLAEGCLRTAGGTVRWPAIPIDHWPTTLQGLEPDAQAAGTTVTWDAAQLADTIKAALVGVARDEYRPILKGVLVDPEDGWSWTSTDGSRLVRVAHQLTAAGPTHVIGADSLKALAVALGTRPQGTVAWSIAGGRWMAVAGPVAVAADGYTGRYPDYRRVLPEGYPAAVAVDRDTLRRGLAPFLKVAGLDRAGTLDMTWTPAGLAVATATLDHGRMEGLIPVLSHRGVPDATASFAPALLADLTRPFGPGPVEWAWSGQESPAEARQGTRRHIVLPLRHMA